MVIPKGVTNWGSFSSPCAWSQLGRLCPYCLMAGAGIQLLPQASQSTCFLTHPPLAPGGQILAKQGAGCMWGQELCPLPEGRATRTFKTSCSMVLLPHP